MRIALLCLTFLLSTPVISASTLSRVWELKTDFDGGKMYATDINEPVPGGPVSLTPGFLFEYDKDPFEAAILSSLYWTKSSTITRRTFTTVAAPAPTTVVGSDGIPPALVSVGNYIYLIGGCTGGGISKVTQSKVWYCEVVGGVMQDWKLASWEFGQTLNDIAGVPIAQTKAVAVGNRIYVAGGSTMNCGNVAFLNGEPATPAVYSALVDPITHDVGPWVKEPSLLRTAVNHGLVYAAGALYTIGGREKKVSGLWAAHRWVQKAEIKPDGHLSNWEALTPVSIGIPPWAGGSNPYCECTNIDPLVCKDLACCREANLNLGWESIGAYSVGRTIGFLGGAYTPLQMFGTCEVFQHGFYAYLDDNNRIIEWIGQTSDTKKGRPGTTPQIYNGTYITAGGGVLSGPGGVPDVIHNPLGGDYGIERDSSYGYDATEMRPNYEVLFVDANLSGKEFNVAGYPVPSVLVQNYIFVMGLGGSAVSADVYRTTLKQSPRHVNSAYYISNPVDIGGNFQLKNVKWSFIKNGVGTIVNPDDWAMVRYRLADESMTWGAWTPRIPEAGNMPLAPGTYEYSYLKADGTKMPRSSKLWMPLNTSTFRYIQFEVSLYKDGATANLPEFTRFEISYQDPPAEYQIQKMIEAFPVPAVTELNLRFTIIPEGAEVKVRLFNVAGDPVAERNFVYGSGGDKLVNIPVSDFANGTYIAVVTADSIKDGQGGLLEGTERRAKGRIKVVVRHKK